MGCVYGFSKEDLVMIFLIERPSRKYNQVIMVMPGMLLAFCQRDDVTEKYQTNCATCGLSYCRVETLQCQELKK